MVGDQAEALLHASVGTSDFESAFAGIRKTVDATEPQFAELIPRFKGGSTPDDDIPPADLIRRVLLALFTCWAISVLAFAIIQLPPGDFVDAYISNLSASGSGISQDQAEQLRAEYALDQPIYVQYLKWMKLVVQGDFGMSFDWNRPVADVIGDRLVLSMVVSVAAILFTWVIALPIGVYSAVRQYSALDYTFTLVGGRVLKVDYRDVARLMKSASEEAVEILEGRK